MAFSSSAPNETVRATNHSIERLLGESPAYRKIDTGLYVIKQGSCLVMISVHPWKDTHVIIRLTAQLVKGVTMEVPLALELLELNAILRFGSFAYIPKGEIIVFSHTLLDRTLSDEQEFLDTVKDFAIVADEYDDRIAARYGGSTMQDLLEDQAIEHMQQDHRSHDFWKS